MYPIFGIFDYPNFLTIDITYWLGILVVLFGALWVGVWLYSRSCKSKKGTEMKACKATTDKMEWVFAVLLVLVGIPFGLLPVFYLVSIGLQHTWAALTTEHLVLMMFYSLIWFSTGLYVLKETVFGTPKSIG